MRILYFSRNYSPHDHRFLSAIAEGGGHETYFLQLERNTRQIEDRPVPSQVEQILWSGSQREFRWRDLPRLALDLKRVIRKIRPDLIHAGPIQTCAFLVALTGFRPLFTMSWGYDLMEEVHKSKWMERITRFTLKRSTFFTSDANVTCEKGVAYGMNPKRTVVFPWGVDLQHFTPKIDRWSLNTAKSPQGDHFVLFCNRSWEPLYGVDVLARAFVKVAQQNENASLILLNGGSQGHVIRGILQSGGVMDRVTFGGQVSQKDLPDWYLDADLYISPSHVDGSSVSLMEALACGLPCLVSDIPGNKEWVTNGENGWLFRDGDVDDLAEKILSVISQKEKLPEIGRAGRRSAERRADWQKNAEVLMKSYETAVKLK
jgi:glycosyltransferase involved in cell wall biosynthesis